MSDQQSNLSLPQYGYDMVVATTQASINATLNEFLSQYNGQDFISCYVWQADPPPSGSYVAADYSQLVATAGMDLFSIPSTGSQNAAQQAAAQKAYDANFSFGFKATMGLPDGFPLSVVPDVVILDQGNAQVTYNLFFKDFAILNIDEHHGGFTWTNMTQAQAPAPWVFQFTVKLDLNTDDTGSAFNSLPTSVQTTVKNLNPNSMFSVQQLYLDLNTAGLESSPSVQGLDPTTTAAIYLNRVFLASYWTDLTKQNTSPSNPNGNFLLGYSIKPVTPSLTQPTIIPTDLNIMVSPNVDGSGNPTKNYDLYTLNYLVMSNNHHMPAAVVFGWNWVDPSEQSSISGTMAIKKGTFVAYLSQVLSPSLASVCIIPTCSISVNLVSAKIGVGYKNQTAAQNYRTVNDNTSHVLTFSYSNSAQDSDTFVPNWGNVSFNYNLTSDLYLEGNIIRSVTVATAHCHINVDGGVTDGDFVVYKTETSYEVGVDQYGNLVVAMAPGSPKFSDISPKVNPDGWSEFVSAGTIDSVISQIKGFLSGMKTFLVGHDTAILSILKNAHVWVFPGGKTFIFKDAGFSANQDLITHVTYADPS